MSQVHDAPTLVLESPAATSPTPRPIPFAGRRGILLAIILSVVVPTIRLIFVDGWLRPVSIEGPSMAPAFRNEHFHVTCGSCNFGWDIDATAGVPSIGLWCPNCGELQGNPQHVYFPTDRVRVDRWPIFWGEPSRWDVVAIMAPLDNDPEHPQAAVKRIVGLPGETIDIEDGDLFVNGVRPERRIDQWRQTAIVVHDDLFREHDAQGKQLTRWQAETGNGWLTEPAGYRFDPFSVEAGRHDEAMQRLVYHHERLRRGEHVERTAPLDDDPYNQGARELEPAADLAISARILLSSDADLELSLHDGTAWRRAVWSAADDQWRIYSGDRDLPRPAENATTTDPQPSRGGVPARIEWLRLDGSLLLVINGWIVARREIADDETSPPADFPEATEGVCAFLGARGGSVQVEHLQVLRDIHYLSPPDSSTATLGNDEYFVLGDNSPVSIDSRHWPGGSINREQIWGIIRRPR